MSISGLHVTLVSGLAAWLVAFGWRRVPAAALRLPARKAAAAAAIVAALGYTLLAGFAVPAQRTLLHGDGRRARAVVRAPRVALAHARARARAWSSLADPWALLAPGFWLSFGAVALIFYVGGERASTRSLQWGRVQWAITVGLAPAALLLFGQVSVAGPLANAVAIPVVSVVVTPLALLAAVMPGDCAAAELAAWLVEWLLPFLDWCAALPGALGRARAAAVGAPLALAGVAWLLAPRGVPGALRGAALMAPAFALAPPRAGGGRGLDHLARRRPGLAVLVRTATARCSTTPARPTAPTPTAAAASSCRSCAARESRGST